MSFSQALPSFLSFSILQVTESWAGPGNEASTLQLLWFVMLQVLCHTLAGNPCYLITITDFDGESQVQYNSSCMSRVSSLPAGTNGRLCGIRVSLTSLSSTP